jgi:hypothetical protein
MAGKGSGRDRGRAQQRKRERERGRHERRRRTRRWEVRREAGTGFEPLQTDRYTIEGQIQQLGLVAQGINRARYARGWRRGVARGCQVTILLFLVAGAVVPLAVILLTRF